RDLGVDFESGSDSFRKEMPTLVMIHGAGGCSEIWKNQTNILRSSINTLALDLPGHGKTSVQGMLKISEYTGWLKEVLENAFDFPVYLMGHSMGGAITQDMAILYPHLVKAIILVATGPRLRVAPAFLDGLLTNFEDTVDEIMKYAYAPGVNDLWIKEGAGLMKKSGSIVVRNDFLACDGFDSLNNISNIKSPCLVICGDKDKLTPVSLSNKLSENITGSIIRIISTAGHMVMIERYKEFNESVREFVLGVEVGCIYDNS
ncbi:MAG TPA: alpha/beta hydrolase, partial [Desulfobacteraceae bacterium]|nr:alpha/beta hydrolase [Desulfobacteraceae bacterium]HPQ29405.1 alpha/beta hydrolase [Desulfobacteraceae bacterium]